MSPSTPTAGGMSSKVLTMKFMQRAAASATSGESSPIDQSSRESSHSAKKRRLANGSANTATTAEETAAAVKAAVKEMEDRQQAAMERHVENTADTHWVLPEVAKQLPSKPALNVLVVGWNTTYGEDSDVEADIDDPKIGRTQSPAYRLAAEAAATAESAKQEDSDSDSGSDSNAETRGTSGKYKKMKKITSISGRANFDTPPKKAFGGPVASPRSGGSASSLKRQRKMSVEDLRGKELRDRRLRKEVRGSQMSRSNGGGDGHSPFGQRSRH